MKKIISILSIILIFAAIGFGAYFGWQKSKEILTPPSNNQQPTTDNQQLPPLTSPKPKLQIISDQPVFDYWTAVSGDIFYINLQGQILQIADQRGLNADSRGQNELISDREINDIISIKSNKDGTMVIIKYGDLSSPRLEIFEVDKAIWQPLADNITAADFSPDSSKLIYLEKAANGVSNLVVKDINVSKPKTSKILSLTQVGFDLKWLSSEKVLLVPAPSIDYTGEIWQFDIKNKTMKFFLADKGLSVKWNAEGDFGLQLNRKNQINLIDNNGNIKANMEILTMPDKCFINLKMIYCAVMQNYLNVLPKPALPDDYLKKAFYSRDKIYAIGIADNSSEIILSDELPPFNEKASLVKDGSPAIDAVNLSLNGNNLLFINRYDNRIYQLEL